MHTTKININTSWKFHLGDESEAWYKGFDDTAWEFVTIPHDWSVSLPFSKDCSSGTGYLQGGIGWYRKTFDLKIDSDNERALLLFDGVYKHAKVWVNSYYLGSHAYGYTPFSFDITDFLSEDGNNVISVRVEHSDISDSRWFTGSGIYRDVCLMVSSKVHLVRDGVSFVTDGITDNLAKVRCTFEVTNDSEQDFDVAVYATLSDSTNVYELPLANDKLFSHETKKFTLTQELENPSLWDIDSPNLYTLTPKLIVNGNEQEELPIRVGIRSFAFSPEKGFLLNERSIKIKGVCVHHDGGALGAAMTKEVWKRRLLTLRKCGCNAIRMSHNPHMPALYDLCDELGFVVMDEAFDEWENAKNKWWQGHNVYPPRHQGYFEDFPEWHERDLRAMVRRDRVHPCVFLYSIGNEIDYPNDPYCHPSFATMTGNNDKNKPAAERQYDSNKPNMERLVKLAKQLSMIVKDEEEDALVTMALAYPELSVKLGVGEALDVLGFNYKEHLYDETHRNFPDKPLLGSENGHSYANWNAVVCHDEVCGQFLWTGIDYFGETIGWPCHGSYAGLLTTAGFPKTEFYQTKSYWKEEQDIFLATVLKPSKETWLRYFPVWNYEEGASVFVKCYAPVKEGARVSFYKDDECIKEVSFDEKEGAYFVETTYEAKELIAVYTVNGCVVARTSLRADSKLCDIFVQLFQEGCFEDSMRQLEVALLDEDKNVLMESDVKIEVQVSGAGEFVCMDNGDLMCTTNCNASSKSTYMGRTMIYVRRTGEGTIYVNLKGGTISKDIQING